MDAKTRSKHCDRLLNSLKNNQEAKDILLDHVLNRLKRVQTNNYSSKSSDKFIKGLNKLFPEQKFNTNIQEETPEDDVWEMI